jgi:peptidoglycan L-alanyl-D-glutamate endopeptidase CwlK
VSFVFGLKSEANLSKVHPKLAAVARRALELSAIDFSVIEGLRSFERQKALVAQGASKTMHSYHLLQNDGWAHAFDVMAAGDLNNDGVKDHKDVSITWDPKLYGQIAGVMKAAAKELGVKITWGGDFQGFFDAGHYQIEV